MADPDVRVSPEIRLGAIITRACRCGHPRTTGTPCEGCGNTDPPVTEDLGTAEVKQERHWLRRLFS